MASTLTLTWKTKGSSEKKPSESGKGSGKGSEAGGVHIEMLICGIIIEEDVEAVEVPMESSSVVLSCAPSTRDKYRLIVEDDDVDPDCYDNCDVEKTKLS
jgi:hypothetical protein